MQIHSKVSNVHDKEAFFLETLNHFSIRTVQLAEIFSGIENQSVEIGAIDPDTAHFNHVDMLYVCAIARNMCAEYIFEFGTYLGRTTYFLSLAENIQQIYTLDLDPTISHPHLKLGRAVQAVHEKGLQGYFFKNKDNEKYITQLHGDSRTFDYSSFHKKIDFIFIDGGHSYELVKNDTQNAMNMLKKRGIIVWHDFAAKSPEVVAFAREFSHSNPLFWIKGTSLLVYIEGIDAMNHKIHTPPYARSILKPSIVE